MECFKLAFPALVLANDGVGRSGPAEGRLFGVTGFEIGTDGLLQLDDGAEDAAPQPPFGPDGEHARDVVDRVGGGRREVDTAARMAGEPPLHGLGLMGGMFAEDQVPVEFGRGLLVEPAERSG